MESFSVACKSSWAVSPRKWLSLLFSLPCKAQFFLFSWNGFTPFMIGSWRVICGSIPENISHQQRCFYWQSPWERCQCSNSRWFACWLLNLQDCLSTVGGASLMRCSGKCPKCGGVNLIRIPDNPSRYASGNNIYTSTITLGGKIPVIRYVCCDCGYVENWVEQKKGLAKIQHTFR